MLVPSKKIFYAIEAVLYIAYNAKTDPVAGSDVAAAQNLPTRYLEPIMQKLVRSGVLRGVRGPQGGYLLGRERRRITLADICAVITDDELPKPTTALGESILVPATHTLMEHWRAELNNVTIAMLCERAVAAKIPAAADATTDFTI